MRPRTAIITGVALLVVGPASLVAGLLRLTGPAEGPADTTAASTGPADSAATPTTETPAAACGGAWDCAQQERFAAAAALLASRSGHIGVVVRDRVTGAEWRAGEPDFRIWSGSTPKLALAMALREQARAGQITLDATANRQIAAMLSVSDNRAADALWNRYARAGALMARFRDVYGMRGAGYVDGFPSRWGFVKCTAQDLANLMSYILDRANPADHDYAVQAMRSVGAVQQWGVWGAGPALRPGVKNGWSIESDGGRDHWITATVGFAGPDERYVVAAMYHQPPGGDSIERGVHTLTDLVATIFGAPVPAPAVIPDDY